MWFNVAPRGFDINDTLGGGGGLQAERAEGERGRVEVLFGLAL